MFRIKSQCLIKVLDQFLNQAELVLGHRYAMQDFRKRNTIFDGSGVDFQRVSEDLFGILGEAAFVRDLRHEKHCVRIVPATYEVLPQHYLGVFVPSFAQ